MPNPNSGKEAHMPTADSLFAATTAVLGVFLVWVFNRKYHFRALQKLHITNKFGEQDVRGSILIQENRLKANPDNPEETQP